MSVMDFSRCTPYEFQEIISHWRDCRDAQMRDSWEQTRFLATAMLQPYARHQLHPSDVLKFAWDPHKPGPVEKPSTKARFEELAKAMHLKTE
jgi:hypothetical protein